MTLTKIISGGQTGADQGALHGARLAGLETGGAAPKGYWTENGEEPVLLGNYGLIQTTSGTYPPRTRINVLNSDGTIIFGNQISQGSKTTRYFCRQLNKPYLCIVWPFLIEPYVAVSTAKQWLNLHNIKTLNVAGNRESKNPGIHDATSQFVVGLVEELKKDQIS